MSSAQHLTEPEYRYVEGADPTDLNVRYVAQKGGKMHFDGRCAHLEQSITIYVCPPDAVAQVMRDYCNGWAGVTGPSPCHFCNEPEVPEL